jgi:hypothetical protein
LVDKKKGKEVMPVTIGTLRAEKIKCNGGAE